MSEEIEERMDFELYKSHICHKVKREGDLHFIRNVLLSDEIIILYNRGWHPESLYLLAMVDYLSRLHNIPLFQGFDGLRKLKFNEILYPSDIILMSLILKNDVFQEKALKECIPEFLRHNIVESEIRNVF
jgi:hypothetical protein